MATKVTPKVKPAADFKDVFVRAAWTFVQAFAAVLVITDQPFSKAGLVAGLAAGISAVKSFIKETL